MTTTGCRGEVIRHLEQIGLSPYEAQAYVTLLASPGVNGYALARRSGIPTSKVYETLRRLIAKGAVLVSATKPPVYRAVSPDELIAGVRRGTERSLAVLANALPDLAMARSTGVVWRLNEADAIMRALEDIVAGASHTVHLSIWPPEAAQLVQCVGQARKRGVRIWVASFGASPFRGLAACDLLSCGVSSAARLGKRLTAAIADDRRVLIAELSDAGACGTLADDPSLAVAAKEYVIHDIVNHVLIEELGRDRFAALRRSHPLVAGLLGPAERPRHPASKTGAA